MAQENDRGKVSGEPRCGAPRLDRLVAHRQKLEHDCARYRRLEARWSWIRLLAFVAGAALVILVRHDLPLLIACGTVGLACFATAVWRHGGWEGKRAFTECALVVTTESLDAGRQRDHPVRAWQRPHDPPMASMAVPPAIEPGPTWSLTDQERDDLDLYGPPVGIFGWLNRTSTDLGARRLRDMLDQPCLSCEHILQRQRAVRWLHELDKERLAMMASAVPLRTGSRYVDELAHLLHTTECPPRSAVSAAIRLWSVFSGLLVLYSVARIGAGDYVWLRPFVAILLLNGLILSAYRRMFRRLRTAISPWAVLPPTLRRLLAVAERADRELPDEPPLSVLKEHFHRVVMYSRIPSLCMWLEWAGLHGMVRGTLNAVIFLDLHVAEAGLTRIASSRDILANALSAMAESEAICSLACVCDEDPSACYPQPGTNKGLTIIDGRHPLILDQNATPNSVHLTPDGRTWVITGPNAAGKSTFLRMVGVNVLLAQIGAAVPATDMTFSPVRLITDVRIRDDLAKRESYFLSEVRRLRRMVLDSDRSTPVLGLIDEPFRGTNSQERRAAGIALLEHLVNSGHLFLIATHEETLAQVAANTPSAQNYHFQEHLHEHGILFDYRLRPGPAVTRTALRILEQEGYPKPLLDRARRLMPPD
jgi:ABC-type lipoprotein export system ATPase subunit